MASSVHTHVCPCLCCSCALQCLQPVLPSSGLSEWLTQLCTPPSEADISSSAASSGAALPATGVLIDTLKHLNPGIKVFRYPDAKRPGKFKERPPYTAWSPMRNIRWVAGAASSPMRWCVVAHNTTATQQSPCDSLGGTRKAIAQMAAIAAMWRGMCVLSAG